MSYRVINNTVGVFLILSAILLINLSSFESKMFWITGATIILLNELFAPVLARRLTQNAKENEGGLR